MAGHGYIGNAKIKHAYIGNIPIKKGFIGNQNVFSTGNICTYRVDSGVTYSEEVDEGASCLNPRSFTPSKSGWTFVGWREDSTASGTVLPSKTMGDSPITLYAVFSVGVTVTKYNGSTSASTETKQRYYNNGNIANPSFTLSENNVSGWSKAGWSTSASGYTANVSDGGSVTLSANSTYYSLYTQAITVTYYNNSSTASTTSKNRIVNYHSGATSFSNPTFNLTVATVSGWNIRGWSTSNSSSATISYNSGANFTRDSNVTLYASWSKSVTVTYYNNSASASTSAKSAYRSYNGTVTAATFNLSVASVSGWSARGWSTANGASASITYSNGTNFTRDSNVTLYASWSRTVTVTYNGNGGSGSVAASTGTAYRGYKGDIINATISLRANGFSKSGWTFKGWGTSASADAVASSYTGSADTTRYAVWKQATSVCYDWAYNWIEESGVGQAVREGGVVEDMVLGHNQWGGEWGYGTFKHSFDRKHCDTLQIDYYNANSQGGNISFGSASVAIPAGSYTYGTVTLNVSGQPQVADLKVYTSAIPTYSGITIAMSSTFK